MMQKCELVFLWDNFGPYHNDRCEAVATALGAKWAVFGLELFGSSGTYPWLGEPCIGFTKQTLSTRSTSEPNSFFARLWAILRACFSRLGAYYFFCHYERPEIFLAACILRIFGQSVFVMNESKFDDYDRHLYREMAKSILYIPYRGALGSSSRTMNYFRFLGFSKSRLATGYNTVSLDRIRRMADSLPAPDGTPFTDRHFTIVARLVPKKNISMALEAYSLFLRSAKYPRSLVLCGSGPLEADLRSQAKALSIEDHVIFRGWLQTSETCRTLSTSLALLLPSVEEQFGNVVIEAQAMGLPVVLSENCGARDQLVRSGVNGFVVESDNARGMAFFMRLLGDDEALWRQMSAATQEFAGLGDTRAFAEGVTKLIKLVTTNK